MKLFIPGPVNVSKDILKEMSHQMINHRGKEFAEFMQNLQPKLQKLFQTNNTVLFHACSATGIMEASIRNCVQKKVLNLCNGGFSDRWHEMCIANNKPADKLEYDWGQPVSPEDLDKALQTNNYDTVTLVHNESSTGLLNPIEEISNIIKKYPNVVFIVDAVSSLGAVDLNVDKLNIDVCLAGTQKALGVPPGLSMFSLSKKAIERSKTTTNKGYYFDFIEMLNYYKKNQPITTPPISQLFALDKQLDKILKDLEGRFNHHKILANKVQTWAKNNFEIFPKEGFESKTITCIKNTKNIDIEDLKQKLKQKGFEIVNGYGKIKDKTFRIGHMADTSEEDVNELLKALDSILN